MYIGKHLFNRGGRLGYAVGLSRNMIVQAIAPGHDPVDGFPRLPHHPGLILYLLSDALNIGSYLINLHGGLGHADGKINPRIRKLGGLLFNNTYQLVHFIKGHIEEFRQFADLIIPADRNPFGQIPFRGDILKHILHFSQRFKGGIDEDKDDTEDHQDNKHGPKKKRSHGGR
jgi:hypothetical protein